MGLRDNGTTGQQDNRTTGLRDYCLLCRLFCDSLNEAVQTSKSTPGMFGKRSVLGFVQVAKPACQVKEILGLRQGRSRYVQEMQIVALGFACCPFDNIRGNRIGGTANLTRQSIDFFTREVSRMLIDGDGEIVCQSPSFDFSVVAHRSFNLSFHGSDIPRPPRRERVQNTHRANCHVGLQAACGR